MTTLSAIPSLSNELRSLYRDGSARLETEFKEAWKHAEVQLRLEDY